MYLGPFDEFVRMRQEMERMMNEMVRHYEETSKPIYCAKKGFVDEVVRFGEIRRYMVAFAGGIYQNPRSICPHHHMLLPRLIRSQVVKGLERPS